MTTIKRPPRPEVYRGRYFFGELQFDGKHYQQVSAWDCDEDADAFIDALERFHGVEKVSSDRTILDGILTLWHRIGWKR